MAADLRAPDRVFGFFTFTAGLNVLGVRFAEAGFRLARCWPFGRDLWLLLTYGCRRAAARQAADSVLWRHVRRHWPLSYEPALWSIVFPLGMYSVATLSFGKAAQLSFMEPLARFMFWVSVGAWIAVAATFLRALLISNNNSRIK